MYYTWLLAAFLLSACNSQSNNPLSSQLVPIHESPLPARSEEPANPAPIASSGGNSSRWSLREVGSYELSGVSARFAFPGDSTAWVATGSFLYRIGSNMILKRMDNFIRGEGDFLITNNGEFYSTGSFGDGSRYFANGSLQVQYNYPCTDTCRTNINIDSVKETLWISSFSGGPLIHYNIDGTIIKSIDSISTSLRPIFRDGNIVALSGVLLNEYDSNGIVKKSTTVGPNISDFVISGDQTIWAIRGQQIVAFKKNGTEFARYITGEHVGIVVDKFGNPWLHTITTSNNNERTVISLLVDQNDRLYQYDLGDGRHGFSADKLGNLWSSNQRIIGGSPAIEISELMAFYQ